MFFFRSMHQRRLSAGGIPLRVEKESKEPTYTATDDIGGKSPLVRVFLPSQNPKKIHLFPWGGWSGSGKWE